MSHGFTLFELLLALALVAVVSGIALPRLQRPLDRLAVERAVFDASAAHQRARSLAIARNRPTVLQVRADSLRIRVLSGIDSTDAWAHHGPAEYGVALSGPSHWLRFDPTGLGAGVANGTWSFSKGRVQRRVIASRVGRLRVSP
jgi:prepilin-type N-terminal cleavage/methylation domain-containing protein